MCKEITRGPLKKKEITSLTKRYLIGFLKRVSIVCESESPTVYHLYYYYFLYRTYFPPTVHYYRTYGKCFPGVEGWGRGTPLAIGASKLQGFMNN